MAEFYKFSIADWNVGTDNLTLEQEAAFLRVVNAIRLYEQPIKNNLRVLAGLWRCNERRAKRILEELIELGKLSIEGDSIVNRRAVDEASTLRRQRLDRQSNGHAAGIESGKARRKTLKNNDQPEKLVKQEKSREEKSREESPPAPPAGDPPTTKTAPKATRLPDGFEPNMDWAVEQGMRMETVIREKARFFDYWQAKGGQDARKTDWMKTWRNWVRRAIDDQKNKNLRTANPQARPMSHFMAHQRAVDKSFEEEIDERSKAQFSNHSSSQNR